MKKPLSSMILVLFFEFMWAREAEARAKLQIADLHIKV